MEYSRIARNLLVAAAICAIPLSTPASYVAGVVPVGGNTQQTAPTLAARSLNVLDFGAKCDAVSAKGTMTVGSNLLVAGSNFAFNPVTDIGKPIVVSGAASWTLSGTVNSGSNVVFNVGYYVPCLNCTGGQQFYSSLVGAAGSAMILTDTASAIAGQSIATEFWGTPDTGTFNFSATTTSSTGSKNLTVPTIMAPLVGLDGQIVQVASGTNHGSFAAHQFPI